MVIRTQGENNKREGGRDAEEDKGEDLSVERSGWELYRKENIQA